MNLGHNAEMQINVKHLRERESELGAKRCPKSFMVCDLNAFTLPSESKLCKWPKPHLANFCLFLAHTKLWLMHISKLQNYFQPGDMYERHKFPNDELRALFMGTYSK